MGQLTITSRSMGSLRVDVRSSRTRPHHGRQTCQTDIVPGPSAERGLSMYWQQLVKHYSQRLMSFQSDKLPALSGIANEFNRLSHDQYLAGLWRHSLPFSLLWFREEKEPDCSELHRQLRDGVFHDLTNAGSGKNKAQYIAPSWSPLSLPYVVAFENEDSTFWHEYRDSLVTVVAAEVKPTFAVAPFGQISSASLQLRGPTCLMSWSDLTAKFVFATEYARNYSYCDFILPDEIDFYEKLSGRYKSSINAQRLPDEEMTAWPKYYDAKEEWNMTKHARFPERPTPPDAQQKMPPMSDGGLKEPMFWLLEISHTHTPSGLLLTRVPDDTYMRVGYFYMGRNNLPPDGIAKSPPRDWDLDVMLRMRELRLI